MAGGEPCSNFAGKKKASRTSVAELRQSAQILPGKHFTQNQHLPLEREKTLPEAQRIHTSIFLL